LRFRLSLWLNPLWLRFPLATFLINVSGTLLLGGLTVLYHHLWNGNVYYMLNLGSEPAMVSAAYASAYLLPALMQGFCGCFTTVSTFVNEVRSLPAPYEYAYAGASIVTAQALLVPIYVGYFKTR
jgi:fluoride ion exporter CrcB/FEX